MLKNGILEAPWGYFRTQKLKMLKNSILETPWGYFRTQGLKMFKNCILEAPWGYFRVQGLKMLIGTQTKSELKQNRNSDKIGTQTKSGLTENSKGHGKKKVSGLAPIFIISKPKG